METVMLKIVTESSGKQATLKCSAHSAYEELITQHGNPLVATCDLRETCLSVLEMALESNVHRLVQYGLEGLQILMRDNQLHSLEGEIETPEQSLPMQVINTLHNLPDLAYDSDVQCHCFTVILQLVSNSAWQITPSLMSELIELSIRTYVTSVQNSVKMAARATVIQSISSFSSALYKEQSFKAEDAADGDFDLVFKEISAVGTFIAEKFESAASAASDNSAALLLILDSLLALIHSQPIAINRCAKFTDLLRLKIIPLLIGMFSADGKSNVTVEATEAASKPQTIDGSCSLFGDLEINKNVYNIIFEIFKILGPVHSMRNALELLFQKTFSSVTPGKRLEALKVLKKAICSPDRLLNFWIARDEQNKIQVDLSLWEIILRSLVECACSGQMDASVLAVEVTVELISSVETLCTPEARHIPKESISLLVEHFRQPKLTEEFEFNSKPLQTEVEVPSAPESPKIEESDKTEESEPADVKAEESMTSYLQRVSERVNSALKQYVQPIGTVCKEEKTDESVEKHNAEAFLQALKVELPNWVSMKSGIELDEALQTFSSQYCEDFMRKEAAKATNTQLYRTHSVLNADCIYLTIYQLLSLNLQLKRANCYQDVNVMLPCTKERFVKSILSDGSLVFGSESWVSCVYDFIRANDITKDISESQFCTFFSAIEDFDGSTGQLLSDLQRLEKVARHQIQSEHEIAATKLCRFVLSASWNGLVQILSALIDSMDTSRPLQSLLLLLNRTSAKAESAKFLGGIAASLQGLQKLAHLCNILTLQSKSGWIFRKLVEASCPLEEIRDRLASGKNSNLLGKFGDAKPVALLQVPHVLSIDVVLTNAIDMGSHSADCWTQVVRCCEYILELDRLFFSSLNPIGNSVGKQNKSKLKMFDGDDNSDDTAGNELYLGLLNASPVRSHESIAELLEGKGSDTFLDQTTSARVVCALIAKVDRLFEQCAKCLNLQALIHLMEALISASQTRMFYSLQTGKLEPWAFVQRIADLTLRLSKSSRPLVHLMKIWALAGPHFVEAACAKVVGIQTKIVDFLHDCIAALLSYQQELNCFHFNESLFLPLQMTICLEMCHTETQDQIVSMIAEFVESQPKEIRSGWRPLFTTLKALRTAEAELTVDQWNRLNSAIFDVFNAFLKPDNLGVFCSTAMDCISCLLRLLNKTGTYSQTDSEDDNSDAPFITENSLLCDRALSYLIQIHRLLALLTVNPHRDCLIRFSERFSVNERGRNYVDDNLGHLDYGGENLPSLSIELSYGNLFETEFVGVFLDEFQTYLPCDTEYPWRGFDVSQQIIQQCWLYLIEGLVGCVAICSRFQQPKVIDTLQTIIESLKTVPGIEFGCYCLNDLVLPMIQSWLRRESGLEWRENKPSVRNFKQCVGQVTSLIVDYFQLNPTSQSSELLLSQSLSLFVECVTQPSEIIARLGSSCMRHLILSLGPHLSKDQWDLVCRSLWKTCSYTLRPLRVLMSHFAVGSYSYCGDLEQVQVALRKDSNPIESARSRALAQQVFLLDSQKFSENLEDNPDLLSRSHRSVVFFLHHKATGEIDRLPLRAVVVGLLSNQLLLQLIGTVLLETTRFRVSGVSSLLTRQVMSPSGDGQTFNEAEKLPGFLDLLTCEQVSTLLLCLDGSFHIGHQFDLRPGLKFLVQKVFNSTVAANLYKQSVTAWSFKLVCLFELSLRLQPLSAAEVNSLCELNYSHRETQFHPDLLVKLSPQYYLHQLYRSYANLCQQFVSMEKHQSHEESQSDWLESQTLEFLLAPVEELSTTMESADTVDAEKGDQTDEEQSAEPDEKIYSVVTNDKLNSVLSEYKRSKTKSTMPPTPNDRPNPFSDAQQQCKVVETEEQIETEEEQSVIKDSQAWLQAWAEMTTSLLKLLLGLPDRQFRSLLPLVLPSYSLLIAQTAQPPVRRCLADLSCRITEVFSLATNSD